MTRALGGELTVAEECARRERARLAAAEWTRKAPPIIDEQGVKHPLALVEGATENATVVTDLLTGLRERGLDVTRPILVGIDGAKALHKSSRG